MKGHMVRGLSDISSMSSICDFDIQHDMRLRNEILNVKAKADNTSPALKFLGVHILWKCCKDLSRKGNVHVLDAAGGCGCPLLVRLAPHYIIGLASHLGGR